MHEDKLEGSSNLALALEISLWNKELEISLLNKELEISLLYGLKSRC